MTEIINMQAQFDKPLDIVKGNEDYFNLIQDLEFIEKSIENCSLDTIYMQYFVDCASSNSSKSLSRKQILKAQSEGLFILRSSILRKKLKLNLRPYASALAATPLYQKFCGINRWLGSTVPSKSKINTLENSLSEEFLNEVNAVTNKEIIFDDMFCKDVGFQEGFEMTDLYADTTCVKANIHFPVDWVLFRDLIRTSMLKVQMIRDGGIKNRMSEEPNTYLSGINSLCMEMHAAYNYRDASKKRKAVFRRMKKYLKATLDHAGRHLVLFQQEWQKYGFSHSKATEIINSLTDILGKREEVVRIANKRIISEKFVKREDKILSIYEGEVHIIKRSKHSVKSEFGNTLQIVEQQDGFIVDCSLLETYSPGDPKLAIKALEKIRQKYSLKDVLSFTGDRGYDSKEIGVWIQEHNDKRNDTIDNTITRKNVKELQEKMQITYYKNKQKRRATTEAKIAHIKEISQNPMKQKGIQNRKIHMGLSVLTHNLFKFARMNRIQLAKKEKDQLREAS